jgi:hypothetical protein
MIPLIYSTASQEVLLGPFLDSTDGNTTETGLTIANTDIKLWKAGATSEANKNSGGATHIASGRYYAVLDATDTDTYGPLEINVHVAGALPIKVRCNVMSAAAYNALYGTTLLTVNTTQVSGTTQTAGDLAAMITTVDDLIDTEIASMISSLSSLATSLGVVDDLIDTEIAAIQSAIVAVQAAVDALDNTDLTAVNAALATIEDKIDNLSQATVIKNAAYPNFGFPMKLSSDHFSAATGKTVTGQRRLDNGSLTAVSGTITEVSGGLYEFDALAADTNGDSVVWIFSAADCDDTIVAFKTSI